MSPSPTHSYEIGGRRVLVFDDLFDQRRTSHFANIVMQLAYTRKQSFDRELNVGIDRDAFVRAPFLYSTTENLFRTHGDVFAVDDAQTCISHVYAAAMTAGDRPKLHTDSPSDQAITFLYYANLCWHESWGGETVFYSARRRPLARVAPRPGRMAMFHSNILHRGGAPARDAPTFRYTVSVFYYPTR